MTPFRPRGAAHRNVPLRLHLLAPLFVIASPTTALELDPVVVTASRVEQQASRSASAVSVLSAEEIRASGLTFAADLLRTLPGIAVNRGGMPGNLTQVRMRGGAANHTLVLVDGVEANNPVAGSEFDFAHLLAADVERIEVVRGPHSTLHGSEAVTGVINVITRAPGRTDRVRAHAGYGGMRTREAGIDLRGATDGADATFSVNWLDSAGDNVSRFAGERDGYRNLSLAASGRWNPTPQLHLDGSLRRVDARSEFDRQDFTFPPTPTQGLVVDSDDVGRFEHHYARVGATLEQREWQHLLRLDLARVDSEFFSDGARTSESRGQRGKLTLQGSRSFGDRQRLTVAAEAKRLDYRNGGADAQAPENQRHHDTQYSAIAEHRVDLTERLMIGASGRFDANDGFSDQASWQLAAAALLPNDSTRLRTSVGRAFKNPGFFELYGFLPGTFVGNPELRPETSLGWEVGIEQRLANDRVIADLGWFSSRLQDEIVTVFDADTFRTRAENLDRNSRRDGLEASVLARPHEAIAVRASYTWTDSRQSDRTRELRRPRHTGAFTATLTPPASPWSLSLGASYTGTQFDAEFVPDSGRDRVALDAFWLTHANLRWTLNPAWSLVLRAENLLDSDYEEQYSYRSPGRTLHAGVRWQLER